MFFVGLMAISTILIQGVLMKPLMRLLGRVPSEEEQRLIVTKLLEEFDRVSTSVDVRHSEKLTLAKLLMCIS